MATLEQAYDLAVQRFQAGDVGQAQQVCRQILAQVPQQADTLHLLGVIEHSAGRNDEACELIGKAVAIDGANASFHLNLGLVHKALGRFQDAIDEYRRAVELDEDFAEALCNLGNLLWEQGEMEEAAKLSRRAIKLRPDLSQAHNNLANALKALGRPDEAIGLYEDALQRRPDDPEVMRNLGNLLRNRGRHDEAIARLSEAVRLLPKDAQSHICLGQAQLESGWLPEAQASFEKAVKLNPGGAEGLIALGNALKDQGQAADAIGLYRRALQIEPNNALAHDNLLFTTGYLPEADPMEMLALHVQWGRRAIESAPRPMPHLNSRDSDRRLRIGYVSPDFCAHAVACFLVPILAEHDAKQVEVYCYAQVENPDSTTEQFQTHAHHWRNTCGVNDDRMAQMIRDDGIDVLVDLAGHTQNNRLPVLARKPSPVQATYLGYGHTTGLETVDYRLTDGVVDPEGEAPKYVEKLVRFNYCFLCYAPPRYATDVQPLPAKRNGHITFGSITNPAKLNEQVFDLWAHVLDAVPDARMLMVRSSFRGTVRDRLIDAFTNRGIDPNRVSIESDIPEGKRRIQTYDRIDIALDTFPYAGATTTCEAMWMGVPTIALYGDTYVARMSATVLERAGLCGWVADSPQTYARIAARMASEIDGLAQLRAGLREQVAASPLCDAALLTRSIEAAYRQMWRQWCETTNK